MRESLAGPGEEAGTSAGAPADESPTPPGAAETPGSRAQPKDLGTSVRMSRQARRDTRPEVLLRRELHRRGLRYRIEFPVPGLPRRRIDVAFVGSKVAIFVDGCFWHSCPVHRTAPANNGAWWEQKLGRNVARDRETDAHLQRCGWHVVRIWEHEEPASSAERIADLLTRIRSGEIR